MHPRWHRLRCGVYGTFLLWHFMMDCCSTCRLYSLLMNGKAFPGQQKGKWGKGEEQQDAVALEARAKQASLVVTAVGDVGKYESGASQCLQLAYLCL